ncbi:MAG: type III secretion system export apparatus subunit SctR [Simkaniaceae bacterium]|nr:type III secretion system export apparatus subunit SctR [Simkaniaceae bacterium]
MRLRFFFLLLFIFGWQFGFAAEEIGIPGMDPDGQPNITTKVTVLAALSLLPFAVMLLTSFLKTVIVLSLVRNAIGVQQSPPNQALTGIAILMAVYVMFPVGLKMYEEARSYIHDKPPEVLFSGESAYYILNTINYAKEPLREFLIKNTIQKHMKYFYSLAYQKFPEPYRSKLNMKDFIIVVPAYITTQIKSAFEVGVLIYLPFFVIDLVVSNILLAMGMMMLSPLTIALPLKLLLLVMVDGWTLIIQGLVLSYK